MNVKNVQTLQTAFTEYRPSSKTSCQVPRLRACRLKQSFSCRPCYPCNTEHRKIPRPRGQTAPRRLQIFCPRENAGIPEQPSQIIITFEEQPQVLRLLLCQFNLPAGKQYTPAITASRITAATATSFNVVFMRYRL